MNANGIAATVNAATSATGQAAGSATGKTGSAGGFATALVQAVEGTGGTGASATGSGLPAGLTGLLGLLGGQTGETSSNPLAELLSGLTDQLNGLAPDAELPAELQELLAALLLMVQNLLNGSGANVPAQNDGASVVTDADGMGFDSQKPVRGAQQDLIAALRESLVQLQHRLAQGGTLNGQAEQLEQTLKQAFEALQPWTSSKGKAGQASESPQTATTAPQAANPSANAGPSANAAAKGEQTAGVQAEAVSKTVLPLRSPVWHFHQAQGTEAGTAPENQAVPAAESAETSGQNGTALAWTLQRDANAAMPVSPSASAGAPAQVPVQQFADHMGKFLVKQFILTQGHGTSEAKISLHPEHLGQVDIKITIQNGLMTAQFVTENGAARDMLETQLSQLRAALQGQGLQVDKMEVVQQSSSVSADSAAFFQGRHEQSGNGRQGGHPKGRGSSAVYEDAAAFEAELDRTAFLREIGYGSSLNVTA
ncbi:hypothetical protein GE107_00640 [Cohnella sp. CFH 77786]|uniref:flagellar hook-length control protein FliK n=1 Tax=Cohnella sp. CFH 77786 TaxID=2662265 RepID=UPI001C60F8A4|nr:flagellar hook-length control protein FliK [Cohnella sp. CFH 77786]MBW5444572.1 hypothetical protein [Cohnella sp. CFH 77786]